MVYRKDEMKFSGPHSLLIADDVSQLLRATVELGAHLAPAVLLVTSSVIFDEIEDR